MAKLLLSLFLFSVISFGAHGKDKYLITTTDRVLLSHIKKITTSFYKRNRINLVRLNEEIEYKELPGQVQRALRPIEYEQVRAYYPRPYIYNLGKKNNDVLKKISSQRIKDYLINLTEYDSRRMGSAGNLNAQDWLKERFVQLGMEAYKDCFKSYWSREGCNVIGYKKSHNPHASTLIILGHFDSVGKYRAGADDNASGTVGVLELAHIFADVEFEHNLLFMATDGEELGLLGSRAFVNNLKENNALNTIRYALNMDMIGYNKSNIISIETNVEFENDAKLLASMIDTYTEYQPEINTPAWGSDHEPFVKAGVPAALTIEDWDNHNPCYHQSCDTIDKIDFKFMEAIIKSNAAMILALDKL